MFHLLVFDHPIHRLLSKMSDIEDGAHRASVNNNMRKACIEETATYKCQTFLFDEFLKIINDD